MVDIYVLSQKQITTSGKIKSKEQLNNSIMDYKGTIDNYTISFRQIGGNYNYGIFDVQVETEGQIIYSNSKYYYDYHSWGATYTAVLSDIFRRVKA